MTAHGAGALQLNIVANDLDPDGSTATMTPSLQTTGNGRFSINNDKSLSYTPVAGYVGVDRATYKVTTIKG